MTYYKLYVNDMPSKQFNEYLEMTAYMWKLTKYARKMRTKQLKFHWIRVDY